MVDAQQRLHVFLQFFFMKLCVVQYFVYLAQESYVSTHGTVGRKHLLLVSLTSSVEHFVQKRVGPHLKTNKKISTLSSRSK